MLFHRCIYDVYRESKAFSFKETQWNGKTVIFQYDIENLPRLALLKAQCKHTFSGANLFSTNYFSLNDKFQGL